MGVASEKKGGDKGSKDTSWVYHSREHGFSLRFPTSKWVMMMKQMHIADFWRKQVGSPMRVAVFAVNKQTAGEFRKTAQEAIKKFTNSPDVLIKPAFKDGETKSGNLFSYCSLSEKGKGGDQYLFIACSLIWIKAKGMTVMVGFEGRGMMRSKRFQAKERSNFENAAKAILLSVE
jgi:hypothetical protein